jgi:tetratricopeptide (TPR) repeat protein
VRRSALLILPLLAACASPPPPAAPPDDSARLRADAEFLQKRDGTAEREYERLLSTASNEERGPLLVQLGRCRLGKGDASGALSAFDQAATNPASPLPVRVEAWYRRGIAHNIQWRPDRALLEFRKVLDAPKDARESAIKSDEFLYRLGVTCLRVGQSADGRKWLEQLVREHPESPDAGEAKERLALKAMHIQIGRTPNESSATRKAADAKAKGLNVEVLGSAAAPGNRLIVVGRFTRFEDALRELEKIKSLGYADAFPIP